jgi:hypothetical protein
VAPAASPELTGARREENGPPPRRKYRGSGKPRVPHTWRTRVDPCADGWLEVAAGLAAEPHRTAKPFFEHPRNRDPGSFAAGQLRILQRRVKEWRRDALWTFAAGWLEDERQTGTVLPGPLGAIPTVAVPSQNHAAEERVLTSTGSAT